MNNYKDLIQQLRVIEKDYLTYSMPIHARLYGEAADAIEELIRRNENHGETIREVMRRAKRTERGWGGHFIMAHRCLFRRNTLVELDGKAIVVSTVGNMLKDVTDFSKGFDEIGRERCYETMAFYGKKYGEYIDADVSREISFKAKWAITKDELEQNIDCVDEVANAMHERVVEEIMTRLEQGELN